MRVRAVSPTGDYVFGSARFLVDTPQAVGQVILQRLKLQYGELFFATDQGVPYATDILGFGSQGHRDTIMRSVILQTEGVTSLIGFASDYDARSRVYLFAATVQTLYGAVTVSNN